MNFLQIAQRTREKCGISGSGPASVTGQSGESLRIVNWVNESWMEIQNKNPYWLWMRKEFSFQTVLGQQDYPPLEDFVPDFSDWHKDTLRCYRTSIGLSDEQWITNMGYDRFRDVYQYSTRITGKPHCFAVRPRDKALLLGPTPTEAILTVVGEYQQHATEMVADLDVPGMPSAYHMLIVYGAMQRYAEFESAPEVMAGANASYAELRSRLEMNQLPEMLESDPLV